MYKKYAFHPTPKVGLRVLFCLSVFDKNYQIIEGK